MLHRGSLLVGCVLVMSSVALVAAVPEGWTALGRVPPAAAVPVLLAVRHDPGTYARIADKCLAVSDPRSPTYGQHMSQEEVRAFVSSPSNLRTVMQWLASHGVDDRAANNNATVAVGGTGDFVRFSAPAATVEKMFGVRMTLFRVVLDKGSPTFIARSLDAVQLPRAVADAVDAVVGVEHHSVDGDAAAATAQRRSPAHQAMSAAAAAAAAGTTGTGAPELNPFQFILMPGNKQLFILLLPMSAQPFASASYQLDVTVTQANGAAAQHTVTVPNEAVVPVKFGSMPTFLLNTSDFVTPYASYNATVTAIFSSGNRTQPVAMNFEWSTLPATWTGVTGSPLFGPAEYLDWYGIHDELSGQGSFSVYETGNQYFDIGDLNQYMKHFGIVNNPNVTVVGPPFPPVPGVEAQMDIELMVGLLPSLQPNFWLVEPTKAFPQGWMLEFASLMCDAKNPPLVTSISYAGTEAYTPSNVAYYGRAEAEFAKMCLRGLSVTTGSGDAGASDRGHGSTDCAFSPQYPASSSWVTTLSATQASVTAPPRPETDLGEMALTVGNGQYWTTGGGFSGIPGNVRPAWQDAAVSKYLKTAPLPPPSFFNSSNRAYPDVSSIGTNYWITLNGKTVPLGSGTSSASPTFASVIARLNDARLAAGKPPVGFFNPLMYQLAESHPAVWYDVTVGNNKGAEFAQCSVGYEAAVGWDAVTGLGSVGDYALLKTLVMAAADKI